MRILVGTIIANAEEAAKQWLTLQLAALRATVDFEHVAVIPPGSRSGHISTAVEYFSKYTMILTRLESGPLHPASLSTLQKHFLQRQKEFDGFLFLDSDAFPIRKGWLETLMGLMTGKHGSRYDIATIYRPEFGETRLHASVLYATHPALEKLRFVSERRGARGGDTEKDTYIDPYTDHWRRVCRLVRTNRINVHPVLAGVYGDMFYHHGCGSRNYFHKPPAWWPLADHPSFEQTIPTRLREKLVIRPREFLSQFLWDPSLCALPDSICGSA